jgi:hypothetical protein
MKTGRIASGENAVMRYMSGSVLLAVLLSAPGAAAASPSNAPEEASFFCYWIDGAHKQAATTGLFRAAIERSDAITLQFTKAIQAGDKVKGRVYDCGYRRDPVQAEQDRQSLRAAHEAKGFSVADVEWNPSDD